MLSLTTFCLKQEGGTTFQKNIYLPQEFPIISVVKWSGANFDKAEAKDFYWILNEQNPLSLPTGPTKWNKKFDIEIGQW